MEKIDPVLEEIKSFSIKKLIVKFADYQNSDPRLGKTFISESTPASEM